MQPVHSAAGAHATPSDHESWSLVYVVALVCLIWYFINALVCSIGITQIWRHFSKAPPPANVGDGTTPHVTVIRPVKGLELRLYDCLASTFYQTYPHERLHIRFCVADRGDPAVPIIEKVLVDFPEFDAQLFVEEEDGAIRNGDIKLGPNPKIRNMSRAYREAVGDVVWIIDCNIWVSKGVCARMIARLQGAGSSRKNKFVHQLPLTVDIEDATKSEETESLLLNEAADNSDAAETSLNLDTRAPKPRDAVSIGGGRLDEMFMASAHAKFYTAINTVQIAPCIVGKSTMFWRGQLNSLTNDLGIDYFSENICEDHLIGDLLWKKKVPEERVGGSIGKHAMCFGDLAIQPTANMSVREYWSRRVRWLRVRKYTVTLATLVEPGTESFLCSLYGAFAVTTLPYFNITFGIPHTWTAFTLFWCLSVGIWCFMDRLLYLKLHSGQAIEKDANTPDFVPNRDYRPFGEWFAAWLGRESLALPIWLWAFWGGATVEWRGRKFWVDMNMKVHELRKQTGGDSPKFRND